MIFLADWLYLDVETGNTVVYPLMNLTSPLEYDFIPRANICQKAEIQGIFIRVFHLAGD